MFERALNAFWILLGAAAATYAWTLGVVGPSGPESGLFPLIAAVIIMGAGIVLFIRPADASGVRFPRGAALARIVGVVAGLAVMAIGMPYLGFAVTGAITMMILLRTVEQSSWSGSIALALAAVAAVMWLFGHVLGMILPRGPWGF
jgi:hypothetical protein